MNCKNCGYSILPGESFCTQCGTPVGVGGVDTPANTTTTSGGNPLLGFITVALLALQAVLWFMPTIKFNGSKIAMGAQAPEDVDWVFICMIVCVPMLAVGAIRKLLGTTKGNDKGKGISMAASVTNLIGMFAFYLGCNSSDWKIELGFLPMGYIQMLCSVACIVICLINRGTINTSKVKTLTTKPTATDYEKTVDYSSAPGASVGGSVGGDYYPSAPVSAGKTVKCHLCDFDVPFGESYCTRCGTTIVEPTMRVPGKAAPAVPVTPVAPATPAAPSAPSGLKGTAASATPVSAPAPKPAPKPSAPKAPPAGFGHCDDLD